MAKRNFGEFEELDKKFILKSVALKDNTDENGKEISQIKKGFFNGEKIQRNLAMLVPPVDKLVLREVVVQNDTISQAIEAYAMNIAGFGIEADYNEDEGTTEKETVEKEWLPEWEQMQKIIDNLNLQRPAKEVIQEHIRHVEETGDGYLEIVRDGNGNVVGIENIQPEFVTVSQLNYVRDKDGRTFQARYFYVLDPNAPVGETGFWFKTFGDTTPMNADGTIAEDGRGSATEVINTKIGDFISPYGLPRWFGALVKILGDREADLYNYRFFKNGTASPMAMVLTNAELTEGTEQAIAEMKQSDKQHKMLIVEAKSVASDYTADSSEKPNVKFEKLTETMQKDATFLQYNANVQQAIISAFRLPPIYIAKTQDYNRATAETAKELTEEQVFQPLREMYSWQLSQILKEYDFKYCHVALKTPVVTNVEDISKVLSVATQAGAVTINNFVPIISKVLGIPLEKFEDGKYNQPIIEFKAEQNTATAENTLIEQPVDISKAYGQGQLTEVSGKFLRYLEEQKNEK